VADPLRALECSPLSDGAAALIVVNPEIAERFTDTPIYIVASQKATDSIDLGSRRYMSGIPSTEMAVREALKEADVEMGDIHLAEVHDSYTPYELFFLEDSGFIGRGEAWKMIDGIDLKGTSKHIPYINGKGNELIVNAGGGLKADGDPLGATGIRQICEIVSQLRGEAGDKQVEGRDLNVSLAHNIGGTGGICNVHILVRDL
jgi:acetyl-CoA C-acetyltransferase